MRKTIVVPDLQVPFHEPKLVAKLIDTIARTRPDQVVIIGDLIDFPQVSRWTKGSAGEYADTLSSHLDSAHRVLSDIRTAAGGAPIVYVEGNHDVRIKDYVAKYAPALRGLDDLRLETLLELDDLDIKLVRGPVKVAPNTIAIHGHEPGGYCASPSAWDAKFQRRYGQVNVLFGHTHQPFLITSATGHSGRVAPRWTMNVGSLMNPRKAGYVGDGAVNWTPSFGVIYDNGRQAWPALAIASAGRFVLNGEEI